MALSTYTEATNIIGSLGTTPEDRPGMTDQQLKDKFDENAANWKAFFNDTTTPEIDALITAIKGAGWTSESLKGLADLISTHTADLITDSNGAHGLKVETGTFTPVLRGSVTAGSNTYAIRAGFYYKIGAYVRCDIFIRLTAKDAAMAGDIGIGGLPFTVKGTANRYVGASIGQANYIDLSAGYTAFGGHCPPSSTVVSLLQFGDNVVTSALSAAAIAANTDIILSISYEV